MKNFEQKLTPESGEEKNYVIGREGNEFDVYKTVRGKEAAIAAYADMMTKVASPSEIVIYEEGNEKPEENLMQQGVESLGHTTNKDISEINLDDAIDVSTAEKLDVAPFRGSVPIDFLGNPGTLDDWAKAEARSLFQAWERRLQTAVDPSTGVYLSWGEHSEPKLVKVYNERVQQYLEDFKKNGL